MPGLKSRSLLWQPSLIDDRKRSRAGFHEGDQIELFLFRHVEFLHLGAEGGIGGSPLVVVLNDLEQRLQASIMHGRIAAWDSVPFQDKLSLR